MIVDKTKFGVAFFDACFGGVFRGRQVLCTGKRGCGKTALAYHFLGQALREGDRALLLSPFHAKDTIIVAESMGIPFASAVESGQLAILEYSTLISETNMSDNAMLPPQAFVELQELIEDNSIRRVAFDTVLPWLTIFPVERLTEHVYSFTHAIERLGVTALFTLPKPVSRPAFLLKARLEDICPIVLQLNHVNGRQHTLQATKYLGEILNLSTPFPFVIEPNTGIRSQEEAIKAPSTPSQPTSKPASAAPVPPDAPMPAGKALTAPSTTRKPIQFSSVIKFPGE